MKLLKDNQDAKPLEMVAGIEKRLRKTERKDLPLILSEDEKERLLGSLSGDVRHAYCAVDMSSKIQASWLNTAEHPATAFVVFFRETTDGTSCRGVTYWPDGKPFSFYDTATPE